MKKLTHLDEKGKAKMVDVSQKDVTLREAIAQGEISMAPETLNLIKEGKVPKGDVLSVAKIAGIMAAKRTPELIPLCHPLKITHIDVELKLKEETSAISIKSVVRARDRTGVEMEALTAIVASALAIYDMCKGVDKKMVIRDVRLVKKSGGKSGDFTWKN